MKRLSRSLVTIALALFAGSTNPQAFVPFSFVWPDGAITMHLQLGPSGVLLDGASSWGQSAEAALAIWNPHVSRVQFGVVRDSTVPTADGDDVNNVFFSNTVYGMSFGTAVAVATSWRIGSRRVEGDVIFNNAYSWNSYRGPIRQASSGETLYDLRRVAIHEFGHVLGLDHPDEAGQVVAAIMNSRVSDTDTITADDIAGAQSLYGSGSTPSAPGTPTGVAVAVSGQVVTVSWTPPSSGGTPTSYRLDFRSGGSVVASVPVGAVTSTSLTAPPGTVGTFTVTVTAIAGSTPGSPSAPATFTLGPSCTLPAAPTGLTSSFAGGTVVVSWNAVPGATSYIVRAGTSLGASDLFNSSVGALTSVSASGLPPGFRAYVRVLAVNACGQAGPATADVLIGG